MHRIDANQAYPVYPDSSSGSVLLIIILHIFYSACKTCKKYCLFTSVASEDQFAQSFNTDAFHNTHRRTAHHSVSSGTESELRFSSDSLETDVLDELVKKSNDKDDVEDEACDECEEVNDMIKQKGSTKILVLFCQYSDRILD